MWWYVISMHLMAFPHISDSFLVSVIYNSDLGFSFGAFSFVRSDASNILLSIKALWFSLPGSGIAFLKLWFNILIDISRKRKVSFYKYYTSLSDNTITYLGLHEKPMVRAYRVPSVTGSTWCLFPAPEVKNETLPLRGSIVL